MQEALLNLADGTDSGARFTPTSYPVDGQLRRFGEPTNGRDSQLTKPGHSSPRFKRRRKRDFGQRLTACRPVLLKDPLLRSRRRPGATSGDTPVSYELMSPASHFGQSCPETTPCLLNTLTTRLEAPRLPRFRPLLRLRWLASASDVFTSGQGWGNHDGNGKHTSRPFGGGAFNEPSDRRRSGRTRWRNSHVPQFRRRY